MIDPVKSFGETATRLSKNPLGIIALFIVLVYGFAAFVTSSSSNMSSAERIPLIYFLVFFPIIVLGTFGWLVSQHWNKLYGPGDFRKEENYMAVVASLAAATARRSDDGAGQTSVDVRGIVQVVQRAASTKPDEMSRLNILWVDDRPDNNIYERQAFEALGFQFTLVESTKEALELLDGNTFAAIISDMGRREGPQEGYVLLDELRRRDKQTPFFIYAGSSSRAHKEEAKRHGGQGSTNNPQELFQMVTKSISGMAT
jgi:CheY-like chemotaxis protein